MVIVGWKLINLECITPISLDSSGPGVIPDVSLLIAAQR